MTQNQLKAYEIAIRNKELQEAQRANLAREAENIRSHKMSESLTNRENLAKYGSLDYATSDANLNTSWTPLKVGKDVFGLILDPLIRIFGGKK